MSRASFKLSGSHLRGVLILSGSSLLSTSLRGRFLRAVGLDIHATASLARQTRLGGKAISFGEGSVANAQCWIDDDVHIGCRVYLGPRVSIVTKTHPIAGAEQRRGPGTMTRPVSIGDGAWLHANVTILPGAHIAPGCVICAGAVVTKPTEPNGMYAGVPAVRIKELGE